VHRWRSRRPRGRNPVRCRNPALAASCESASLEARLLLRRPLGRGNRFEPLVGNLHTALDGASVRAVEKSRLSALNGGELSSQIIGLSLVEFLFVELGRGIRHLVLARQLLPPRTADSSERLLDPGALAAKKGSGSFEFHLVRGVSQIARCRLGELESRKRRARRAVSERTLGGMPEKERPDIRPQLREYLAWYEKVLERITSGALMAPGEQERLTEEASAVAHLLDLLDSRADEPANETT